MIPERYADVYSNQFTTGKSPFQSVQSRCSTVLNKKKLQICKSTNDTLLYNQKLITCQETTVSVSRERNWIITLTLGFFQIKIENICLFRLIKKHGNVFENWLCPNFLLLPKKSELPKIWGGCSPPRSPRPVRLCSFLFIMVEFKSYYTAPT